jgi:hydroxymethylpyrimidine pyrophosphatase-like HAD family hydrolase
MRYLALVVDYDGTLASHDAVSDRALSALDRLRTSGRRAILVTGRRLDDLLAVFPGLRVFDLIVAENGAVVYNPGTREETTLGNPPPKSLVKVLRERGVTPLDVGEVVVATMERHRATVQDVVWDLGLEAQVIGNRSTVMVLPAGVNKASGMEYALRKLGLSTHEVVGIGDAENDHSFLARCECAVAVANAIASIKETAAFVTRGENGHGVIELIDEVIADDLRRREPQLTQHTILLGTSLQEEPVSMAPYGQRLMVAGPSGSGKSTFAVGVVERLIEKRYQVCIVDPEGDYGTLRDLVALGNPLRAPALHEVLSVLEDPTTNLSINLLGVPLRDRPGVFAEFLPHLQAMRARTGRPHWLVIDEAHHMLPNTGGHAPTVVPDQLAETMLVTVHPDHVAPSILAGVDVMVAIGPSPDQTMRSFAKATHREIQVPSSVSHRRGHVVAWFPDQEQGPMLLRSHPGRSERLRHRRKYAEGDLRVHSFYFRGPDGRLNLKAQNLATFCQIAEGVDEDTWNFHLRRGDYSRWFRHAIKDRALADEAERIEHRADLGTVETRQMICDRVNARYTLPA